MPKLTPRFPELDVAYLDDYDEIERAARLLRSESDKFPSLFYVESVIVENHELSFMWVNVDHQQIEHINIHSRHALIASENGSFHLCRKEDLDDARNFPAELLLPVWKLL
jgi:hypothetical protein